MTQWVVLSYGTCNRDSILAAFLVFWVAFFGLMVVKVTVYDRVYLNEHLCYPPGFYFGDTESLKGALRAGAVAQESFTGGSSDPRASLDMLGTLRAIPTQMVSLLDTVENTMMRVIQEKGLV